ncbi:ankyrin repeat domain-containing protein 63 [Betta splendens]|uniref:Ankyrin repeat domain-containing protein 63 n=1 Tax=Betta splendens TaxID=158456 RepID=A0A6P7LP57_BETSP|nr:ankyrin repeat domain-containing protein 63 [Betta splendens]
MMRPKDLRQGSGTKTFLEAMHGGKVHLARFILDALDGRITNSKTERSRTPLMFAACLQDHGTRAKFTRMLLEKGADVNCQDEDGRTALSHACEAGHLDAVKLLVQFSADPDVSDAWGNTSLMYAAHYGHSQVVEFLVRAFKRLGLRLDRTNHAGHSAVEVANFFGHNQCVQILNFSCRRSVAADDPLVDANEGDARLPSRIPRQVLDRFSKQLSGDDQLPRLCPRQRRIGAGAGLWSHFRCSRSQSQEDGHRHSWALPPQLEGGDRSVLFTAKQLQNCQLRELRGTKALNSLPEQSQRGVGRERRPESLSLWGKAQSFNLELLGGRKQSYQGDAQDMSRSASKLKRASLQDERCLIDKTECPGTAGGRRTDSDKAESALKPPLNGKNPPLRATEALKAPKDEDAAPAKRGGLGAAGRTCRLLPAREEPEPGRAPALPGLGTRLLRRFTAPEFLRMVKDCSSGASSGARGRMSRSETFPLSHTHQQVNSQPSVDSISAVRCEFESSSQSALE